MKRNIVLCIQFTWTLEAQHENGGHKGQRGGKRGGRIGTKRDRAEKHDMLNGLAQGVGG